MRIRLVDRSEIFDFPVRLEALTGIMHATGACGRSGPRVRGGRGYGTASAGRGLSVYSDYNAFCDLPLDDDGENKHYGDSAQATNSAKPDKKRQRISTGTSHELSDDDDDFADFMKLSLDHKMVVMFKKVYSTEAKIDDMYHDDLNSRVQSMEGVMSAHEKRIKLLEYRSIDLEARSRRRNLLFKGIREYGTVENCFELV